MIKTVKVNEIVGYNEDGSEIVETCERKLKASALLPRLYRAQFGRDMIADMQDLNLSYNKIAEAQKNGESAQFSAIDLTIFEDATWLMMKHAGEEVGESPEEWLDRVAGVFSVYEIMPIVVTLWSAGEKTTAVPAKK